MAQADKWLQQWTVQGSVSVPYTVSVATGNEWACSCVGWTRHSPRKDCKHITRVKNAYYHVGSWAGVTQIYSDAITARREQERELLKLCRECKRQLPPSHFSDYRLICDSCLANVGEPEKLSIRSLRKEGL